MYQWRLSVHQDFEAGHWLAYMHVRGTIFTLAPGHLRVWESQEAADAAGVALFAALARKGDVLLRFADSAAVLADKNPQVAAVLRHSGGYRRRVALAELEAPGCVGADPVFLVAEIVGGRYLTHYPDGRR